MTQYIPVCTNATLGASSFLPVSQCGVYQTWLSALGCCTVFFSSSVSFHFDSNRSAAIASSSINQVCAGILTRASNFEAEISKGFFITYYSVLVPSTLRLPPVCILYFWIGLHWQKYVHIIMWQKIATWLNLGLETSITTRPPHQIPQTSSSSHPHQRSY